MWCVQVVHEAYSRFTEESLAQSTCNKPAEDSDVTIKVSVTVIGVLSLFLGGALQHPESRSQKNKNK